ncbi:ATPase [Citromicrobium bathyomarinum]|uniref:F0F1 ATP synthase subunit B family protein n=1 Tax=Sphingomonadales TaxID=204457 RepID=UPI000C492BAA|nr:ATPase [Citromicrobium sp.]MBO81954.1 ATPase [Citromicrobium sp.]|tara:strand:+ start:17616 stop:18110 length:495 start_codon:yes stop_codon:yes gene_type:complete
MPQISQLAETFSSQIVWLLVFFAITYFIVGRGMVPRVMDTMDRRSKQIADDISAAHAAREQADKEEEAWRARENENRARAQALISEAKAEAAAKSEKKIAAAQKRLDKKLEEADERIAASRNDALEEIETVATDATQDIVARLAGIKVAKPAAKSAVKESLANG